MVHRDSQDLDTDRMRSLRRRDSNSDDLNVVPVGDLRCTYELIRQRAFCNAGDPSQVAARQCFERSQ